MAKERFEWIKDRDGWLPAWLNQKTRRGWILQDHIVAAPTASDGLEYVFTRIEDDI